MGGNGGNGEKWGEIGLVLVLVLVLMSCQSLPAPPMHSHMAHTTDDTLVVDLAPSQAYPCPAPCNGGLAQYFCHACSDNVHFACCPACGHGVIRDCARNAQRARPATVPPGPPLPHSTFVLVSSGLYLPTDYM